jgi:subtilisin family serine protease
MKRLACAVAAFVLTAAGFAAPAQATPGPTDAPEYWFDSWHIQQLWDSGVRGQGVTIAEIDTGVNAAIPELSGRILPGKDFGSAGNGQVDREVNEFGHGTAMASIMVAHSGLLDITGMAPDAKILPIAVPLNGTTDAGVPDQLPEAIRWAADHGAKIISMSLGGKRNQKSDTQPCPVTEQSAVFHALRKGAVVIASVGNTGPTKNTVEEPGVCLGVVSVGAVDAAGMVASFSGRQPYLSLVAPGVSIPSLGRVAGEAYSGDGTSQATALASAAAALVWSKYPRMSGRQVITRLLATLDAHRTKPSPAYGYGMLDAYQAVTAKVPASTANPVYDAAQPFLDRDTAFGKDAEPKPPAAAAKPVALTGQFAIGNAPRVTTKVKAGVGIAGAGLLAFVVLLFVVVWRRRQRAAALAALPPVAGLPPGWETWSGWPASTGSATMVTFRPPEPTQQQWQTSAEAPPQRRPSPGPRDAPPESGLAWRDLPDPGPLD